MTELTQIPAAADFANWSTVSWEDGVQIDQLGELEGLVVQTLNSTYEITVLCGQTGEVLVRGGKFFPQLTPATLSGATLGGSFLKMRGIYTKLKMEFLHEGRCIVTSPVLSIDIA